MERLQLTCEVITPLFCAGANQQQPEIRPPSIRGAMRFWYRTLVGRLVRDDVNKLWEVESRIFGTTERASAVKVRVHASQIEVKEFEFSNFHLRYLGFGLSRTQGNPPRAYVAPGTKFDIILLASDAYILHQAATSLWLLLSLGGLGARSRRGWGSLRVTSETGNHTLKFILPFGAEFKNRLQTMLQAVCQTTVMGEPQRMSGNADMPPYPILLPGYWRMKLVNRNEQRKPFRTWEEALGWAGEQLRRFREDPNSPVHRGTTPRGGTFSYKVGRDYRQVKRIFSPATEGEVGPLRLPIFGLPVQYRFQSEHNQQVTIDANQHERRASPLWVRAYRSESGFLLGFMLFKSQFLPEGELLRVRAPGKTFTAPQPDYGLLDEFFNRLPGEEVTL
jgi:CRISPR type III-B/RAMP module RAMP protein Cmr1